MKSKANVKGHPLHPILVTFPIAFFTGTLLFDILSLCYRSWHFWWMGSYLEALGILCGLLAAVPGFIDYLYTVPPKSSGSKRAITHALLNVSMLAFFTIALVLRHYTNTSAAVIIVPEVLGFIVICIAGWLGGTLVYRNQIGVDPRYADAGKWKEMTIHSSDNRVEVCGINDLKANQMKLLHLNGKRIVIARTEDAYVAFDDHCSHKGGSLAGGSMICGTVQCPWHGSQFSVIDGKVKAGPAKAQIETYKTEESNGKVYLVLH
ncbi:MAG: Rieske 2Fe-2S domain-containing protein [Bacteroidetes bacterium]|nr:Rieske 2Fe-2S domain-containing protein [Bacteroidota bacterium]